MENFENYEYLHKHDISKLEDLVDRTVYTAYPAQGVVDFIIRKVEFTKNTHEWWFVTRDSHRLSELGNGFFFDAAEAMEWEEKRLDEYTQRQQKRFLRDKRELEKKEIKELKRLLKKYPEYGFAIPIPSNEGEVN